MTEAAALMYAKWQAGLLEIVEGSEHPSKGGCNPSETGDYWHASIPTDSTEIRCNLGANVPGFDLARRPANNPSNVAATMKRGNGLGSGSVPDKSQPGGLILLFQSPRFPIRHPTQNTEQSISKRLMAASISRRRLFRSQT